MKKTLLSIFTIFNIFLATCQDAISPNVDSIAHKSKKEYWKFSGISGLNISQLALINWAAGGADNLAGRVYANLTLGYKRGKLTWDSNLDTEIGIMFMSKKETIYPWRKPYDKIIFSTKLGIQLSKSWFFAILCGFKSQYAKGFEYKLENKAETKTYVSDWASPSYTDLSVGIDWKPNSIFTVYFSPLGGKITTCVDSLLRNRYGVTADKSVMASAGMTLKGGINYSPKKIPDLKIITTVVFYTPYISKVQKFGNIDVDWDFSISYQFLKILTVSINTALKYYDQVLIADSKGRLGPKVQFKEIVGVGIGYSF